MALNTRVEVVSEVRARLSKATSQEDRDFYEALIRELTGPARPRSAVAVRTPDGPRPDRTGKLRR
jgi:hypothetical protein